MRRCADDKLAFLIEHGGLDCTKEAKAVAHGIMLDLRDTRERIATLEAELAEAQRDATFGAPLIVESYKAELLQRDVAINALRDALEDVLNNATCACYEDGEPGHCPRCAVAYQEARTALAQTPAASLAALKERIATLEAELAASRLDADLAWKESGALSKERNEEAYQWMAHANALRDAVEYLLAGKANAWQRVKAALAQTPAASLAAHDAEFGLRVVSECAMTMRSRCSCSHCDENMPGWKGREIVERALAAQEVTK